jgi:hypothetical protein
LISRPRGSCGGDAYAQDGRKCSALSSFSEECDVLEDLALDLARQTH